MADTALGAIIDNAAREPADLPRLPAAQVFIHYARLGAALERAAASYKHIPACTPQCVTDELKELVKACEIAIKTAQRMIESNL